MASKNTNIVSKTLVESYIRKQVKALKQSPAETIDTLTKQLLDKPKGSLEKYLLHITPEKLQDTQSGYYKLFHDILPKVNTDHLVTLGMNIGYNGIFTCFKKHTNKLPREQIRRSLGFLCFPSMELIMKKNLHNIRHRLAMQKRMEPVALCFLLKKMHGNCFLL